MVYKLSIVKASDCSYLVNHYHKAQDQRFPDFTHAVDRVCMYARNAPDILQEEPVLVGLSDIEERIIHDVRALAINQRLSSKPSVRTTIDVNPIEAHSPYDSQDAD